MSNFFLHLRNDENGDAGLGYKKFDAIPRKGEYLIKIVHEDFDKDDLEVEESDKLDGGMRRRLYQVEAVIHYFEPLISKDEDPCDGEIVLRNVGSMKKFRQRKVW